MLKQNKPNKKTDMVEAISRNLISPDLPHPFFFLLVNEIIWNKYTQPIFMTASWKQQK